MRIDGRRDPRAETAAYPRTSHQRNQRNHRWLKRGICISRSATSVFRPAVAPCWRGDSAMASLRRPKQAAKLNLTTKFQPSSCHKLLLSVDLCHNFTYKSMHLSRGGRINYSQLRFFRHFVGRLGTVINEY